MNKIRTQKYKIFLSAVVLIHIVILSKLKFFPYPELFIYSYLTDKGLIPYKEILDQHFPGVMFFPVNLASLGINTPNALRLIHLLLTVLNQSLLFMVAKKFFKSERKAVPVNVLYLLWQPFLEGYVLWIDSFVVPLLLLAFYLVISKKTRRTLFALGIIMGSGLLFKQVLLPLILILGIYYFAELKKKETLKYYLLGLAIPLGMLFYWTVKIGIIQDFIYWTITFNLTTFSEMGRKFPEPGTFMKILPLYGLAVVLSLYLLYKKYNDKKVALNLIFLLGALAFAYARFDYIHLQPSLPFAVFLISLFFVRLSRKLKMVAVPIYLLISIYFIWPVLRINYSDDVVFHGEHEIMIVEAVQRYYRGGGSVFAMATAPHLNYLTNTLPPGRVFVFHFPWFMLKAEDKIFEGIINDPPSIVVRDTRATTGKENLVKFMPKIAKYVDANYKLAETVDSAEILIPK